MIRAIRDYLERTGHILMLLHVLSILIRVRMIGFKVGFKPAGGIRQAKDALVWLSLMKEELGDEWT